MVFNPPVLRPAAGEEAPTLPEVIIAPKRAKEAYIEQARRAAAWCSVLFIGWLLTRLTCAYDFPPHCDVPTTALEVLTDLLVLLLFGFVQVKLAEYTVPNSALAMA